MLWAWQRSLFDEPRENRRDKSELDDENEIEKACLPPLTSEEHAFIMQGIAYPSRNSFGKAQIAKFHVQVWSEQVP